MLDFLCGAALLRAAIVQLCGLQYRPLRIIAGGQPPNSATLGMAGLCFLSLFLVKCSIYDKGRYHISKMSQRIALPEPVADIYRAVARLEQLYPSRKFTPDGHLVGSYAECVRLVVLKVISPEEAEIVYDGPREPAWAHAGKMGKNGQRVVSLSRLRALASRPSA